FARRPPKIIAEIGTPAAASQSASKVGHWRMSTVKRAFGWAAGVPEDSVQSRPCQSIKWAGVSGVIPSHQTSPSSVRATLVKIVFSLSEAIAIGLVLTDVPGATPKNQIGRASCRKRV